MKFFLNYYKDYESNDLEFNNETDLINAIERLLYDGAKIENMTVIQGFKLELIPQEKIVTVSIKKPK